MRGGARVRQAAGIKNCVALRSRKGSGTDSRTCRSDENYRCDTFFPLPVIDFAIRSPSLSIKEIAIQYRISNLMIITAIDAINTAIRNGIILLSISVVSIFYLHTFNQYVYTIKLLQSRREACGGSVTLRGHCRFQ